LHDRSPRLLHDLREYIRYLDDLDAGFLEISFNAGAADSPSRDDLSAVEAAVRRCRECPLCRTRTNAVPGEGNPQADLLFLGEGPGYEEDVQGRPFVGRAGQLLTKIIEAMGFERSQVYITNVVKCRPPQNRNPNAEEIGACAPYLRRQLELIQPRIIVTLGNVPTQYLLNTGAGISSLRGAFQNFGDILVMPTFHPSYLVRNERNRELKRMVWEDMKKVMAELGRR
jgi:DNA polymerase